MHGYGTLKPIYIILRRRGRIRRIMEGMNPLYMKMSQQNPLYNYYILIKMILQKEKHE
jgi:hypothetical protein